MINNMSLETWKKHVNIELKKLKREEQINNKTLIKALWSQNWQKSTENAAKIRDGRVELKLQLIKSTNTKLFNGIEVISANGNVQTAPTCKLNDVKPLPKVMSWVPVQRNIFEEDETKEDECVEKTSIFLKGLVKNYNGKTKENNHVHIDDATLVKLVQALVRNYENNYSNDQNMNDENLSSRKHQTRSNTLQEAPNNKKKKGKTNLKGKKSVLKKIEEKIHNPPSIIFKAISASFTDYGTAEYLENKYQKFVSEYSKNYKPAKLNDAAHSSELVHNIDGDFAASVSRKDALSSFQALFCRRCFVYDCTLHKYEQVTAKMKTNFVPELQEKSNGPCSTQCYMLLNNPNGNGMLNTEKNVCDFLQDRNNCIWTGSDQTLFRAMQKIFKKNYCILAKVLMTKTCQQVFKFAETEAHGQQYVEDTYVAPSQSKSLQEQIEQAIKEVGTANYVPCDHDGPCDTNCDCIRMKNYCERFCNCKSTCKNRFSGCGCKSQCNTKKCACYLAGRECDPDLCKGCGAHKFQLNEIVCKNVNIQRGMHKHLLKGKSDVAGWGIFAKDDIQKNDFIYEYCGEVISEEEAERRGEIYDERNCSYLFNLNDESVVDATRKGNKIRFANHSTHPNCFVKIMRVNGDHRIGIYALHPIKAGEELFFDYHYGPKHRQEFVGLERKS